MSDFLQLERCLRNALGDLAILAGDEIGPSDVSWQDVAGTCAANLHAASLIIGDLRDGHRASGTMPVFPSPAELVESIPGYGAMSEGRYPGQLPPPA